MKKINKIFRFLISGEVVFFNFLIASVSGESFNFLPDFLSPTILFMVWSIAIVIIKLFKKPYISKATMWGIVLYSLLSLSLVASLFYTTSQEYGAYKTLVFSTYTAWGYLGLFFILENKESIYRFYQAGIIFTLFTSLRAIYDYYTTGLSSGIMRAGVDGGNPITLARFSGLAVIWIIVLFIYNKSDLKNKVYAFICTVILFISIFISGSRMPFISLIFTISLLLIFSFKGPYFDGVIRIKKSSIRVFLFGFFIAILLIPLALTGNLSSLAERLVGLFSSSTDDINTISRVNMFDFAYQMWVDSPFIGNGVGSFAVNYTGIDAKMYPHNIFLEVLAEVGLIGFSVLLIMILLGIYNGYIGIKSKNKYINVSVLSFIFLFLNVNVTGDLNDNRIFFAFLAILTISSSVHSKKGDVAR